MVYVPLYSKPFSLRGYRRHQDQEQHRITDWYQKKRQRKLGIRNIYDETITKWNIFYEYNKTNHILLVFNGENVNDTYNNSVVIGMIGVIECINCIFHDDYFLLYDNNNNNCKIITMCPYNKINQLQGLCFVLSDRATIYQQSCKQQQKDK